MRLSLQKSQSQILSETYDSFVSIIMEALIQNDQPDATLPIMTASSLSAAPSGSPSRLN